MVAHSVPSSQMGAMQGMGEGEEFGREGKNEGEGVCDLRNFWHRKESRTENPFQCSSVLCRTEQTGEKGPPEGK